MSTITNAQRMVDDKNSTLASTLVRKVSPQLALLNKLRQLHRGGLLQRLSAHVLAGAFVSIGVLPALRPPRQLSWPQLGLAAIGLVLGLKALAYLVAFSAPALSAIGTLPGWVWAGPTAIFELVVQAWEFFLASAILEILRRRGKTYLTLADHAHPL